MKGITDGNNYKAIADAIRSKNGSDASYLPSEMAEAIREIAGSGEGLDFIGVYTEDFANELNQRFKDGIEYAKEIVKTNLTTPRSFQNDNNLIFMPNIDWKLGVSDFNYMFANCHNLMYFGDNAKITLQQASQFRYAFNDCYSLKNTPIIDMNFCFFADRPFHYAPNFEHVRLRNVAEGLSFSSCKVLEKLEIENWKGGDCDVSVASGLLPFYIHFTIQNAMSVAEGATARNLKLSAIAKANWEASEYYEADLAVLEEKGITIA